MDQNITIKEVVLMKKFFSLLLLMMICNFGFGATYYWTNSSGGDFWTPANWNTNSDGTGTNPTFPIAQTDYLRIHSDVVGTTHIEVDCPINNTEMNGGIWRNASGGTSAWGDYSLNIHGTGSLVLPRCMGLAYSDYPAHADVNFASGTIYVVGDFGTVAAPRDANSYFKIAHRGIVDMKIGPDANLCMLGNEGIFVAGSGNSSETNKGTLTVAGKLNIGRSDIYIAQNGAAAKEGAIEGRLILEPTGLITGTGYMYIASDANMVGILDVNTGATLDISNSSSRKIGHIFVANYGKGTVNVKSGARLIAHGSYFSSTLLGSNKKPVATYNIENGGSFEYVNSTIAFSDVATGDVNNYATSVVNVAAGGSLLGRSTMGAEGPNTVFTLNLNGTMSSSNYLYLTDAGTATANMNAGSVFTGGKITAARLPGSQATINCKGKITLTGAFIGATDSIGTINISDDANIAALTVGASNGAATGDGTINMSSGIVASTDFYCSGGTGKGLVNLTGGKITATGGSTVAKGLGSTGTFNISGGEFWNGGNYYCTIAEKGNGTMTMTGGTVTVNRFNLANYPTAVGQATITGGRLNVNSLINLASQVDTTGSSTGTLTIGGTADVNVSDWDPHNTSRGIMVGMLKDLADPTYLPTYKTKGTATFILDGSHAKVKTSYFTLGGSVTDNFGGVDDAGQCQAQFKLDGVHGVGSGIYASYDVSLNDGPAANTGIIASFKGTPAVGMYNVIRSEGAINVNTTYTGNLMLNSPGWSCKVVTAGDQQRLKLLYCDKGDNSCLVDFRCFAALAEQWVDGNADGYDLAYLANNWLKKFSDF
jgi:hypothetical protein